MSLVTPIGHRPEHQPCPARPSGEPPASGDILVAWDGSPATIAALQALADERTKHHFILAELGRARPSADDAAAWLISHGQTAQVQRLPRPDAPGPALRGICREERLSLCLAGALCRRTAIPT